MASPLGSSGARVNFITSALTKVMAGKGGLKALPVAGGRLWDILTNVSPLLNPKTLATQLVPTIIKMVAQPEVFSLFLAVLQQEFGLSLRAEDMYKTGPEGISRYFETLGEGGQTIGAGAYQRVFKKLPKKEDLPKTQPNDYFNRLETLYQDKSMSKPEKLRAFNELYLQLQQDTEGLRRMGFK